MLTSLMGRIKAWFTGERAVVAPKITKLEEEMKEFTAKTAPQVEAEVKSIWAKFAGAPHWLQGVIFAAVISVPAFLLSQCDKAPTGINQAAPFKGYTTPAPIPAAAKVPVVRVPVKHGTIQVLDKPTLERKIDLPAAVKNDPKAQVTATASLPKSEGYSVVAFVNTSTGRTGLLVEPKPRPLAEFLNERELGIRYGINTRGGQGGDIYGRYTFARIGNVHAAIYAEASTYPAAKAEVELSYRW